MVIYAILARRKFGVNVLNDIVVFTQLMTIQ
jgi:hypothetical protein